MRGYPSAHVIDSLRNRYPVGTRVELVAMHDPFASKPTPGDQGTVICVDDIGTVHVSWDCGSSLGVVYGEDHIKTV